jgi:RNA polymerase sigma-70 factor (ECF subfamily)
MAGWPVAVLNQRVRLLPMSPNRHLAANTKMPAIQPELLPPTSDADLVVQRSGATSRTVFAPVDWNVLVAQVKAGEDGGMEQLYKLFRRGIRYYLARQLGPHDLNDKVHDTFLIVVKAIQRGDLREPERLMGFVRTVAHRQVAAYIEANVRNRREQPEDATAGLLVADRKNNPEQAVVCRQRAELMKSALGQLSERDREILIRFYLHEQPQAQICLEMKLTETQFRLMKSRAKAKLGDIGKKKLTRTAKVS